MDVRVYGYNFCRCEEKTKSTEKSVSKECSSYEEYQLNRVKQY